VRFRDDILRGLRLGAILLTVFIAGVAAYRIAREGPAAREERQEKEAMTAEAPPPAATRAPDPRFLEGAPLPPPPPAIGSGTRKSTRRVTPVAAPVEVENKPPESVPAPEIVEHITAVEKPPQPEPVPEQIVEAPAPVAPVTKPEARPKRWVRAVGRFLHVVH
jgi:hypothetical protein